MIKVITGPMFSDKSDALLEEYYARHHKDKILVLKSRKDTRDLGVIKAREKIVNGVKIPERKVDADLIDDLSEIIDYLLQKKSVGIDISTILIDEGNFLEGDVSILRDLSIIGNYDIVIAGLNLTSEQVPFGIMPQIMALADEIVYKYASCNECNRPAIYSYFEGVKTSDIFVGDVQEGYRSYCLPCLSKIRKEEIERMYTGALGLVLRKRSVSYGS